MCGRRSGRMFPYDEESEGSESDWVNTSDEDNYFICDPCSF